MSFSLSPIREASECEDLIAGVNRFVERAYTKEDVVARRSYVYEYAVVAEAFAFALHCPGSPETAHLPGFELAELPESLATLTVEVCERMGLDRGRVLFNVGRYPEGCEALPPHYDGELFDFTVEPGVGNDVRAAIRPRQVGLLTLRNDTERCGTWLHDTEDKVFETLARTGDFLLFDNTLYRHSVPVATRAPGDTRGVGASARPPRWIRYTVGWRAFESDVFYWRDGEPLKPISVTEAVELQERFLAEQWPEFMSADLNRASFPFITHFI